MRTLPLTPARARQDLTLQCSLGVQLATRGSATPEVERTYARALELCQQVGNAQALLPVLYGLSRLYKKRGQLRRARDLGEQLLVLAQRQGNSALLLRGHYVLGDTLLWLGEFLPSDRMQLLAACCLAVVSIAALRGLFSYSEKILAETVGQKVVSELRVAIFARLQRLSLTTLPSLQPGACPGRCCLSPLVLPGVVKAAETG